MYWLKFEKFETKMFILSLLASICNFNYLQISVKAKWLNGKKKKKSIGGELKHYLRKKHLFKRNFDSSIAKFFLLRGLILQ